MTKAFLLALYFLLSIDAPLTWAEWHFISAPAHSTVIVDARVTEYAPELGGINCMEPCDRTGYGLPLRYGVGAACGLSIPWGTKVLMRMPWGIVTRECDDHGGGITDRRVDILVRGVDSPVGYYGNFTTVWVDWYPPDDPLGGDE